MVHEAKDLAEKRAERLWIAHSRLLREANDLLMERIATTLQQVPCPARAEDAGFTCWVNRK